MSKTRLKDKLNRMAKLVSSLRTILIVFFIIGLIFASGWIVWQKVLRPVSQKVYSTKVVIRQGFRADDIARLLEGKRLIRNRLVFLLLAKLKRATRSLKAGEYELSPHMNYLEILSKLVNGEVILRKLTVPEGMTIEQIAELWEKKNFGRKEEFIKAASQTELLKKKLYIEPELLAISNLEGYLFPETYKFADGTSANTVVGLMFKEFCEKFNHGKKNVEGYTEALKTAKGNNKKHMTEDKIPKESEYLASKAKEIGMSVHEIVTLASIIESEAHVDAERPTISAVYHNRLKRNRKLEADPTVLYALGNDKKRLTYEDLKVDSPYNTYKYKGLPPGPICNPGVASILAVINPAKNDFMYFVAKGDGTHYFSQTLKEHKKAVDKFN